MIRKKKIKKNANKMAFQMCSFDAAIQIAYEFTYLTQNMGISTIKMYVIHYHITYYKIFDASGSIHEL